MMQNSGLGNAVSPLTSLTWTFRLPQLLIVTWRGQPGVPDEPQHALMGPITPDHARYHGDSLGVVSHRCRGDRARVGSRLAHMDATGRPYALVMQKGSVAEPTRGCRPAPLERHAQSGRRRGPVLQPHRVRCKLAPVAFARLTEVVARTSMQQHRRVGLHGILRT
jgi:phosphonopyruvate decarboxylase